MKSWGHCVLEARDQKASNIELYWWVEYCTRDWVVNRKEVCQPLSLGSFFNDEPPLLKLATARCRDLHLKSVLDFGAGAGVISQSLMSKGLSVVAVEADSALRSRLERMGIPVSESIATIPKESVDLLVVAGGGIPVDHSGVRLEEAIRSLLVFLRPRGRLLIDFYWPDAAFTGSEICFIGHAGQTQCCMSVSKDEISRIEEVLELDGWEVSVEDLPMEFGNRWVVELMRSDSAAKL